MGSLLSARSNNDLVDALVNRGDIESETVEHVFRCVDRGFYLTTAEVDEAYKDNAWRNGSLHISAPAIYANVMEALELRPGLSFLNIGSGTSYLSTMVGLIIGPYGQNHGVELNSSVAEYASSKFAEFMKRSDAAHEFEICPPLFVVGNALNIKNSNCQYDRIYCGAAIEPEDRVLIESLLKVGGSAVLPLREALLKITRTSNAKYATKELIPVAFASLIRPHDNDPYVMLPAFEAPKLSQLCRLRIRALIREQVRHNVPKRKLHVLNMRQRFADEVEKAAKPSSETTSSTVSSIVGGCGEGNCSCPNSNENESNPIDDENDSGSNLSVKAKRLRSSRPTRQPGASSDMVKPDKLASQNVAMETKTLSNQQPSASAAAETSHSDNSNGATASDNSIGLLNSLDTWDASNSDEMEHEFAEEDEEDEDLEDSDSSELGFISVEDYLEHEADRDYEAARVKDSKPIDFFDEQSDRPKFGALMRAEIDRLNLPTSLKRYLMFDC